MPTSIECISAELEHMLLFEGLTKKQLMRIARHLDEVEYPIDWNFIEANNQDETVYIVRTGTVKVHIKASQSREVILAILKPGEPIGEMNFVDHKGRSAAAITREDCKFFSLSRSAFEECLDSIPEMAHNLVRIFGRRLRLTNAQVQALALYDVPGKVAHQFLTFAQEYPDKLNNGDVRISLRLTQDDLAGFVGATRKAVNRAVRDFKASGFISVKCYQYTLHNLAALEQRCK
jgi:CRP-like cAMP-binding protein